MTREEFIECIDEVVKGLDINEVYELDKLYNEVTKPHWISVEDKLPPKKNKYVDNSILVLATDGNNVYKSRYIYQSNEYLSGWFTYDLYALDNIIYWMPLPSVEHLKKGDKNE